MPGYNILLTMEAIYDITDITEYIDIRFGADSADRFQSRLKEELLHLGYMGGIFLNTQIFYKNYAIHKKPFPPSIIFYIIKESQKEIHILRILRNECNWKSILSSNHFYTYPD